MLTQFLKTSVFTNDLIILFTLFVVFLVYALYFGKSRLISFVIAFYPAIFLYQQFPYMTKLMVLSSSPQLVVLNKILIFFLFFIPLDIIVNRFVFSESGYGSTHIFRIAILALLSVVLVLVFDYSVVNLDVFYNFSPVIDGFFTPATLFWWTLAPLALLFFL